MTEATAGVPAQRTDYDPDETDVALTAVPAGDSLAHVEPAAPSVPAQTSTLRDTVDQAGESFQSFASDARDRAGDFAHDAAAKAGDYAHDAAEKAGDYAQQAAHKAGEYATHVAERIRNNAEIPADRGTTTIADEVVEKIAGYAAREVEGVYDLGGDVARVFASVKERVGLANKDELSAQGVTVRLDGKTAAVKIVIVIEYGYVVYSVTEKVRAQVISAVESLLGLEVTAVDITVDDVHIDESKLAATVKAGAQAS